MHPAYLRELYGGLFATVLPDGQEIVWRPLTVGEFVEYDRLIKIGYYPLAYIENEVFIKCVQNKFLVDKINELPAGIVSTVSATILQYSGPHTIDELHYLLNLNRKTTQEVVHQIVGYICQGFPAYKPEDVYAMNYETLMLRLAQAEDKMARLGILKEPITFFDPNEKPKEKEKEEPKKKPTDDLLQKFYEQQGIVDPKTGKTPVAAPKPAPRPVHSPPPSKKQTVVTTDDIKEHQFAYTGHEVEDRILLEHDMVKNTSGIYKDYLDQLQKGGKIEFKTNEQRIAEAKERMKKNQEIIAKIDAKRSEEEKKLQETITQKQASKKELKKRKPGRRR